MSKREKRGKIWAIILLMMPLMLMLGFMASRAFKGTLEHSPPASLLILGIFGAMWSLLAFAVYLGKRWAHILLIVYILAFFALTVFQVSLLIPVVSLPPKSWITASIMLFLYLGPTLFLFLPAPNAFLRYQREKKRRHLSVLKHQLNQIGKNE